MTAACTACGSAQQLWVSSAVANAPMHGFHVLPPLPSLLLLACLLVACSCNSLLLTGTSDATRLSESPQCRLDSGPASRLEKQSWRRPFRRCVKKQPLDSTFVQHTEPVPRTSPKYVAVKQFARWLG